MTIASLLRERTTLRAYLAAAVFVGIGVGMLYLAKSFAHAGFPSLEAIFRETGAAVVVIAGLYFLWEMSSKRSFLEEVFERTGAGRDLLAAGITRFTPKFQDLNDWETLLFKSRTAVILVAFGHTWRNSHLGSLRCFLEGGGELRVILPDPNDVATVQELARRFERPAEIIASRIREDAKDFSELHPSGSRVLLVAQPPVFSAYCFDNEAVVALYTHTKKRADVPTIVCRRGGTLYAFVKSELDMLESVASPAVSGNVGVGALTAAAGA
jgi:hypothetical protein